MEIAISMHQRYTWSFHEGILATILHCLCVSHGSGSHGIGASLTGSTMIIITILQSLAQNWGQMLGRSSGLFDIIFVQGTSICEILLVSRCPEDLLLAGVVAHDAFVSSINGNCCFSLGSSTNILVLHSHHSTSSLYLRRSYVHRHRIWHVNVRIARIGFCPARIFLHKLLPLGLKSSHPLFIL